MAEREGFEPPVRLPVLRISSATHSTTLPPLRGTQPGLRWSSRAVTCRRAGFKLHCAGEAPATPLTRFPECCLHRRAPARPARPCGGIGRRARLKIEFRKECWFDPGQGHHKAFSEDAGPSGNPYRREGLGFSRSGASARSAGLHPRRRNGCEARLSPERTPWRRAAPSPTVTILDDRAL